MAGLQEVQRVRSLIIFLYPLLLMSCGQPGMPSSSLVLLQNRSDYKAKTEPEIVLQGVLSFTPNSPQSPSERASRYTFNTSGKFYYFYDLTDRSEELKSFLGRSIHVKGKLVDIHINDADWPKEVWPAVISVNAQGMEALN